MILVLAIILAIFLAGALVVLIVVNRKKAKEAQQKGEPETTSDPALDCCGAHEVCEFDQIKMDESIVEYYDDEELDVFKHIAANEHTDEAIDQFREVLYTLKTREIRYWLLSIERRKINLPPILQEEARMLMAEG